MVYVGRSCAAANLPPLSAAPYQRPSRAVLRAAVPEAADEQLACVASRLAASSSTQQQRQLRLVFFGSSVTAGIRCTHKKERSVNFPQQLAQLLEHRYPHANVSIDVYGYPGASPSFMRACHSTLMRTDAADLYVLEMTDNLSDGYEGVGNSIEGLMGAIRQRAPAAALVLLAPLPQRCVRSLKRMKPFQHVPLDDDSTRMLLRRDCFSNRSVAASFEDVGRAHNVTTVSARFLVHEQLWRNPANAQRIIGRLHYDAVHPSGGGHWQLAVALEFAIRRLQPKVGQAAADVEAFCTPALAGALEAANLFAPRTAVPSGSMVCALGDDLKRHVLRSSGWRYAVEYNSQGLAKPGFVADAPGATLDLCHRPELGHAASGDREQRMVQVAWSLGYLMSYEHMGKMRGECLKTEGSCSCGARVFNGHWRLPISQPHISRLKLQIRYARKRGEWIPAHAVHQGADDARAACPCVIRLTNLNATDSGEHKMKLTSLMSGFYTGTIVGDAVAYGARYGIF